MNEIREQMWIGRQRHLFFNGLSLNGMIVHVFLIESGDRTRRKDVSSIEQQFFEKEIHDLIFLCSFVVS